MKRKRIYTACFLLLMGGAFGFGAKNAQTVTEAATESPSYLLNKKAAKPATGSAIHHTQESKVLTLTIKQKNAKQIAVKWSKHSNTIKYKVFIKSSGIHKIKNTHSRNTTVVLGTGRKYRILVKSIGKGGKTLAKSKWVKVCIPNATKQISYSRTGVKSIRVTWRRAKGAQYYMVYGKCGNKKFTLVKTTRKTGFTYNKAFKKAVYRFQVRSVYTAGGHKFHSTYTGGTISTKDIVKTSSAKYSYNTLKKDIYSLRKTYPNYFRFDVIGHSTDNRNIYDIVLGNPNAGNTIMVVGAIHGREYMTSQLCMAQLEYYLKHYNDKVGNTDVSRVLRHVAIHFIPMANPDGVTISQYGFSGINNSSLRNKLKKMKGANSPSTWKANARGIDLNRNFNYKYKKKLGKKCSSENFSGKKSNSEPECQSLINLISRLKYRGTLRSVINYHAEGSILFGEAKGPVKEKTTQMYTVAKEITGYADGANYEKKEHNDSRGNFREYVMYKRSIPSITLEIGTGACPLPSSQFNSIWDKNKTLVIGEAKLFA